MKKVIVFSLAAVMVGLFSSATFAGDLGFKGVGGRLSFVKPEDIDGTIGFGGHVDLGEITESLRLYPSVEYWSKSGLDAFSINGDVRYYFPSSSDLSFFGGGGISLNFFSNGSSTTRVALDLLGGVDVPVGENLVATGKGRFAITDDGWVFKITGGITFMLMQ